MSDRSRDIVLLNDLFSEPLPAGKVIGSRASDGTLRRGVDVEHVLKVDHQALRIEPLITPGWGRAGVAYGPYRRQNGLAFAAFVLNGHNSAQSGPLGQPFKDRLKRWLLGSISRHQSASRSSVELVASLMRRVARSRARFLRQLKWWRKLAAAPVAIQKDNLAVGWFASEAPCEPLARGHAFVMTALGGENGELRAKSGAALAPAVSGVQNIPIYYVVVLREEGAAYYAASLADAPGFAAYPLLRPLAIDPRGGAETLYAGLFQSVMGEIGFRSNTRIYGARVARLSQFRHWYGSAHAADRLTTGAVGSGEQAETGGTWLSLSGAFTRSAGGSRPVRDGLALLRPEAPSGLIHVLCECQSVTGRAGIVWRALDERNHWLLSLDGDGCRLTLVDGGISYAVATDRGHRMDLKSVHALQVLDDGTSMRCFLDGQLLFGGPVTDGRLNGAAGVGISACGDVLLRSFEAHPRSIPLPAVLDLGAPWSRAGGNVIDHDPLTGNGEDLAGSVTPGSGKRWARSYGEGVFHRRSHGTRVEASLQKPNPGRTLYTIAWDHPDFADLNVRMVPPGTRIGEGHMGRGGLVCWQDPRNYLVVSVWLDDVFNGAASVSSFFRLAGCEEIYDAVWTNVGRRIQWGVPFDLRLQFDGMHFQALINGDPVLYRALSDVYEDAQRLRIRRVGIAANWEWGDDTGSVFKEFTARV